MNEHSHFEITSIGSSIDACLDDGRPSPQEAWEMMPKCEEASVVWTEEMAHAWGRSLPLLQSGDIKAARTVFEKSYRNAVAAARRKKHPARWIPSLGSDPAHREKALLDAVKKERLSAAHVKKLLPSAFLSPTALRILAHVRLKNIP
ncbi:MAG: hypothetical protein HYS18_05625 [Burkholderiales bacterium]|nr:hypothetical protein [Burkholderiales bacterium]